MFVKKSRYDAMEASATYFEARWREYQRKLINTQERLEILSSKWGRLVDQINDKGGQRFLDEGIIPSSSKAQFTQDEIKKLLQLCHPDKHGGSTLATTMTQKLLQLKG